MDVHIVEDDAAVADALCVALADLNHSPRVYPDGETFLAQASLSACHCVIVDLGLPGMSGSELVNMLSEQAKPPKIIAISGKPRVKLLQHMRAVPGLTVLRKPLSIDMLSEAIEQARPV